MLAYHYNGDIQYNTHNLYRLSEIKTTAAAVQSIRGKRPFVLSRQGGSWRGTCPRASGHVFRVGKAGAGGEICPAGLGKQTWRVRLVQQRCHQMAWVRPAATAPSVLPFCLACALMQSQLSQTKRSCLSCRASFTGLGAYGAH